MSLDLAPEVESTVRQYAEREGVSVDELLARAFPPVKSLSAKPQNATDDADRVNTLLQSWQQEYSLPPRPDGRVHTSTADLFAQWDAEDAALTPEDVEAERRLWEASQERHQGVTI
jgi:hypothetical protein